MDGRRVVVYEITGGSIPFRAVGSFETPSQFMCMYEQNLYTLEPGKIQVRNFQVGFNSQIINSRTCLIVAVQRSVVVFFYIQTQYYSR